LRPFSGNAGKRKGYCSEGRDAWVLDDRGLAHYHP
jgi:hypothetical protein